MKKVLTLLLALALVVCMIPASAVTAFAEGEYTVTVSGTYTYTGAPQTPTISVKEGSTDITSNYEVKYTKIKDGAGAGASSTETNNAPTDAGTYTVSVVQTGVASGTTAKRGSTTFTIAPAALGTAVKIVETDTVATDASAVTSNPGTYYKVMLGSTDITSDCTLTASQTTAQATNGTVAITVKPATGDTNVTGSYGDEFYLKSAITSSNTTATQTGTLTYNGEAQKPKFNVVLTTGSSPTTTTKTLVEGTDYQVTDYSSNVSANTAASATIVGINKYSGSISATYKINAKTLTSSMVTAETVKVGESADIVVKDGDTTLTKGTDYTYAEPTTSTAGSVSVTVNGQSNYTGSVTKSFNVVSADNEIKYSNVDWSNKTVMYTGSSQDIGTTVTVGGKKLTKGTDYKVTYTKDGKDVTPKEAGSYTAKVTGIGSYTGSTTQTFTISPYTLDTITVSFGSTVYNKTVGKNVPSVTVKGTGTSNVIPDTDYSVSYYGFNSTYGTKGVTITPVAKGSYATNQDGYKDTTASTGALIVGTTYTTDRDFTYDGTVSDVDTGNVTVTIDKVYYKDSNNKEQKLTVKSNSVDYVGEKLYVDFTVYDKDARTYLSDSYYNVTYKDSNNKSVSYMYEADTYKITISSTSSYERKYNRSFSVTKTFTVGGTSISNYTVVLSYTSINATGSSQKLPTITKVYRGSDTLSTSEYTATFKDSNNKTISSVTNPGTYTVTVTGKGAYSGSTSATFYVVGKTQKVTWLDDEGETYEYQSYKTYPGKELQLNAKATDGTITYSSSDSSIASVDKYGVVTAYKAGRAKITATVSGSKTYSDASASIVIKVYPKKGVLTQRPWKSNGKVKVRWNKQENVTRYEVRYSRDKNFTTGTYLTKKVNAAENDFTTQSTSLTGLKSGAKYYVKVRAVKEVYNDNGKKLTYYGKWSNWRSVRA